MVRDSDRADLCAWGRYRPSLPARAIVCLSRNTPLGRGLARRQMYALFKSLHDQPVDTELWGIDVRLFPARNVCERKALMRPDQMDRREHFILAQTMAKPEATFVDVGGNAGLYSLHAAISANDDSRIVMIEPSKELISRFEFNLAQAKRLARVKPTVNVMAMAVAVSDRTGRGTLSAEGYEGGRALLAEGEGLDVPLLPLAEIVKQCGLVRIDLIKVDVEGHEDRVLPPFFDDVSEMLWPRVIIIEHLRRTIWQRDSITMAEERGYRQTFTTRCNTVLQRS